MVFAPFQKFIIRIFLVVNFFLEFTFKIVSYAFGVDEMCDCQKLIFRKSVRVFFRQIYTFVEIFSKKNIRLLFRDFITEIFFFFYNMSITDCLIASYTIIWFSASKSFMFFYKGNCFFVKDTIRRKIFFAKSFLLFF